MGHSCEFESSYWDSSSLVVRAAQSKFIHCCDCAPKLIPKRVPKPLPARPKISKQPQKRPAKPFKTEKATTASRIMSPLL